MSFMKFTRYVTLITSLVVVLALGPGMLFPWIFSWDSALMLIALPVALLAYILLIYLFITRLVNSAAQDINNFNNKDK